jgi:O-antigen ligase
MQFIIVLLCISTLATDKSFWSTVSGREFTAYSDELHVEGGSMGYAGTNGLAAFTAQVATFLLALGTYERRAWARISYYGLAAFSAICLMFSLSRGGYAAFVAGCVVIGLLRQRMLLVLLVIFFLTWTTFVPSAVQERVEMTYDKQSGSLDNSSAIRLSLWNNAIEVFKSNMWLGTGFNTYEYMHLNKRSDGVYYADTHNYFIKVLVETGIVGMAMFLWVLARMFREGCDLFRHATDPFFASLGLGAIGWLVCSLVANAFGDRWTFLQVNGYMWVIAGLVCRATQLEKEANVSLPPSAGPIEAATFESPELTLHHA